jgi:hypothetical protein
VGSPIDRGETREARASTRAFALVSLSAALCLSGLSGCKHEADAGPPLGRSERPEGASAPIQFAFDSLDARDVSTGAVIGKPTVVVFMTTWDLSSQAQIDFLVPMSKKDGGAVNYVMVALQEPKERELVEVYASHLGVTFPVALADKGVMDGGGPFGELKAVPTLVILDRAARMVWRHVGLARPEEIRDGLRGL